MVKMEKYVRKSRRRLAKKQKKLVQKGGKDRFEDWWTREGRPKQKLICMSCITFRTEIGVIIVFEGMGKVWIIDARWRKKEV